MQSSTRAPATDWRGGLSTPHRNNFFHGKMMDVYHFELETAYGIGLRRIVNRLVHGTGVVCGLDVDRTDDHRSFVVTPGLALDGWGREIVVPARSAPVTVPPALIERVCRPGYDGDEDRSEDRDQDRGAERDREYSHRGYVTVVLCYQECESDPAPVLAGDCDTTQACTPGTISERYRIDFRPGRVDPVEVGCRFPDVLRGGELDYAALARFVTRECPRPRRDPCIPLANLLLTADDRPIEDVEIDEVQIEIRPVVFSNEILFDLLTRIVEEEQSGDSWRR